MVRGAWNVVACCAAASLLALQPAPAGAGAPPERLGRQILGPRDGWAAAEGGTTGGAAAAADQVYVARNRTELLTALARGSATPKIIQVRGTIDLRVDDENRPLACEQLADPDYRLADYLAAYDPATWGRTPPSGPLEDARARSARIQTERIRVNVGSNTTIVGIGDAARIVHGTLNLSSAANVIVRNIEFSDAFDCFPRWDPTDGAAGNWNSLYDNVTLTGTHHVWIDHCTFNDSGSPDSSLPVYFGRRFQVHDGLLDIIRGSDFVTVSFNDFHDHDKSLLIGSTDNPATDLGRLRVTLHHNRFANLGQRAPRVRFGQVHVYNNAYVVGSADGYSYSWGVGVQSQVYAENNFFELAAEVPLADVVAYWGGTAITEIGSLVRTTARALPVSLRDAYNAAKDPDLAGDAGWTPTLHGFVAPTWAVPALVRFFAGAGRLPG